MKYYYMVDADISGNFMGWFKNKKDFFKSLRYQFKELKEYDEDFDKEEKQAIIEAFKTENDWEETVNSFVYGVSSDKESVWEGYFVDEEDKEKVIDMEDSVDYEFTFSDPETGTVIAQKMSQMYRDYKSVGHAFYAFRRHTAKFMGKTLKYVTQFSEIKEVK